MKRIEIMYETITSRNTKLLDFIARLHRPARATNVWFHINGSLWYAKERILRSSLRGRREVRRIKLPQKQYIKSYWRRKTRKIRREYAST